MNTPIRTELGDFNSPLIGDLRYPSHRSRLGDFNFLVSSDPRYACSSDDDNVLVQNIIIFVVMNKEHKVSRIYCMYIQLYFCSLSLLKTKSSHVKVGGQIEQRTKEVRTHFNISCLWKKKYWRK